MPGLPGTEASQDAKNAGGCGSVVAAVVVILAIVLDPLGFFKQIGTGLLWVVGVIFCLGLLAWVITKLIGDD